MRRIGLCLLFWVLSLCVSASSPDTEYADRWPEGSVHETERFRILSARENAPGLEYFGEICEAAFSMLVADSEETFPALEKIPVRVCASSAEFREATGQPGGRTLAVAYPSSGGMVLNGEELKRAGDLQRRQTVAHEMVHLLLGQIAGGEADVPYWLHEGLAQLLSGDHAFAGSLRLALANVRDRRIPMTQLTDAFPYGQASATLAYMQSADFTRFVLQDNYGFNSARHFFTWALEEPRWAREFFHFLSDRDNVRELEKKWTSGIHLAPNWLLIASSSPILWIGVVALFILAYMRKRRRSKKVMEGWEPWEQTDDGEFYEQDDQL
ncbi:MAG: peptidase MA family metallohydrolase [Candidatus Sumerlaeota bacterium]